MIAYETQLNQDLRWALQEGSMHFEEASAVHRTLRRVVKRLDELGVSYAVAGGMALFLHGFRRFTEDVDILVTKDGLRLIHEQLEGLGYVAPFQGSKNLRDADTGVRIEFLVTGEYPGDGKPKPVAFPDPAAVGVERDGVRDGDRGEEVPALAQPLPQQPAPNAAILQGVEWVEPLQAEGRDIVPGAVNNRDHRPSRFAPHDLPPSVDDGLYRRVPSAQSRQAGSHWCLKSMMNRSSGDVESSITKEKRCNKAPSATGREYRKNR